MAYTHIAKKQLDLKATRLKAENKINSKNNNSNDTNDTIVNFKADESRLEKVKLNKILYMVINKHIAINPVSMIFHLE